MPKYEKLSPVTYTLTCFKRHLSLKNSFAALKFLVDVYFIKDQNNKRLLVLVLCDRA